MKPLQLQWLRCMQSTCVHKLFRRRFLKTFPGDSMLTFSFNFTVLVQNLKFVGQDLAHLNLANNHVGDLATTAHQRKRAALVRDCAMT